MAPLSSVLARIGRLWMDGELQEHLIASYKALGAGLLIATVMGLVIGSLLGVSRIIRDHFDPIVDGLYATPLVALSPILILTLGIGVRSKAAIIVLLAIFPIIVNTAAGIRTADAHLMEAARAFTANHWQLFRFIQLPSAVPAIIAGLRLAVGRGVVGIFVGELFGARAGIGHLIQRGSQILDVELMLAGVVILAVTGVVLNAVVRSIEKRVASWRISQDAP